MTNKPSPKTASKADDPKALRLEGNPAEGRAAALAHASLRPTIQAAATLMEYNKQFGELSVNTLVDDLVAQCTQASQGNLSRAEALLTAQAHTLDAIFNNLARRAAAVEYLSQYETYLRLGLKAQSQCRATLETLAEIKNPRPVAFVKQQNIAAGPQQVNNGTPPKGELPEQYARVRARAEKPENPPNKLLEQQHDEWLDTRATQTSSAADSELATVEAVHRTADAGR